MPCATGMAGSGSSIVSISYDALTSKDPSVREELVNAIQKVSRDFYTFLSIKDSDVVRDSYLERTNTSL